MWAQVLSNMEKLLNCGGASQHSAVRLAVISLRERSTEAQDLGVLWAAMCLRQLITCKNRCMRTMLMTSSTKVHKQCQKVSIISSRAYAQNEQLLQLQKKLWFSC